MLHYSKTAAKGVRYILDHYPDVANPVSILLREIDRDISLGTTFAALQEKHTRSIVEQRVLDAVTSAQLPSNHSVHFMEIVSKSYPPPNIAVVCYLEEPRIVIAVGYIPRRKPPEVEPSP